MLYMKDLLPIQVEEVEKDTAKIKNNKKMCARMKDKLEYSRICFTMFTVPSLKRIIVQHTFLHNQNFGVGANEIHLSVVSLVRSPNQRKHLLADVSKCKSCI